MSTIYQLKNISMNTHFQGFFEKTLKYTFGTSVMREWPLKLWTKWVIDITEISMQFYTFWQKFWPPRLKVSYFGTINCFAWLFLALFPHIKMIHLSREAFPKPPYQLSKLCRTANKTQGSLCIICLNVWICPLKSKKEREGESLALLWNWHSILGYLFNLIQVD